ncbi:hypothetical protein POM88_018312 [Heracleum sosnowskyi]|uniref:ascorbate ferrireductase (transmembrane) n=1 Tax=Heracleum sosnowskyi TaxID=360622 RepID=A0AAD8IS76_9APIA|nr:hypothetical protein POM88_018312 [Heracleum sosnowskyi]
MDNKLKIRHSTLVYESGVPVSKLKEIELDFCVQKGRFVTDRFYWKADRSSRNLCSCIKHKRELALEKRAKQFYQSAAKSLLIFPSKLLLLFGNIDKPSHAGQFLLSLFSMHPSSTGMAAENGSRFRLSAKPVIIFAHLLAFAVTTFILVWLLNFREGIAFESRIKEKIFNLHPLLMAIGFILVAGEAIMTYKTVPAERETQEIFHLILHFVALVAGIFGIYAVFKFHNELSLPNMNTSHSWIGMSTFCLFGLQFLLGFFSFMFPGANLGTRSRMHMFMGIIIFLMAVVSAETGLAERFTFLGLPHNQDAPVMNFTVLLIILSGVAVSLRTRSRMEQVFVGIVIFFLATISAKIEVVVVTPLILRRREEAVIMNSTGILILLFGVAVCVAAILPRHNQQSTITK